MNDCPKWCTEPEDHDSARIIRFHGGAATRVYPSGVTADRISVKPTRDDYTLGDVSQVSAVTFFAAPAEGDSSYVDLPPKEARTIALVVEFLKDATPEQHSEYAAGIRAAAEAIEPEMS